MAAGGQAAVRPAHGGGATAICLAAADDGWPDELEEPHERAQLRLLLKLTATLGWLFAIAPLLITAPSESTLPPAADRVVRLSWSALCLAGVAGVLRAPAVPERWRMAGRGYLCLLLGAAAVWPLADGPARWWLGGAILAGFVPPLLLGWRQRQRDQM